MKRHLNNTQGFTLLELLIAMVLMTTGVFAVIGMQTVALKGDTAANQLTVATSVCQQVLEELLSRDKSSPSINPVPQVDGTFVYNPDPDNPANDFVDAPAAGRFATAYTLTFGTGANGIPSGLVRIVATVTYANNKTVSFTGFKGLL